MTRAIVLAGVLALVGCKKHKTDETAAPATKGESATAAKTGEAAKTSDPPTVTTIATTSGAVKLKSLDPTEAQDLATLKDRTTTKVSQWLTEETLPDGWAATYAEPKIENVEDNDGRVERKQTGETYGIYVHRTIDGKLYKCVAKVERREDIAAALAACKTAKP